MTEAGATVICDTSPLFYLHQIGQLDLLRRLYDSVVVTRSVVAELAAGEALGEDVPHVEQTPWLDVRQVSVPSFLSLIPDLGQGEASVLALAAEVDEPLLVLDDKLARSIANLHGFRMIGTAGILIKSKRAGLVSAVAPLLSDLIRVGFYISPRVCADVLDLAGEG